MSKPNVTVGMLNMGIALADGEEDKIPVNILLIHRDLEYLLQFVAVYIERFEGIEDMDLDIILSALPMGEKTRVYTIADLVAVTGQLDPRAEVSIVCEGDRLKRALRGFIPYLKMAFLNHDGRNGTELTFEIGLEK